MAPSRTVVEPAPVPREAPSKRGRGPPCTYTGPVKLFAMPSRSPPAPVFNMPVAVAPFPMEASMAMCEDAFGTEIVFTPPPSDMDPVPNALTVPVIPASSAQAKAPEIVMAAFE